MKTDSTTASGITNGTVRQQRSKAIDMRFYWLKDRVEQGQFKIFWEPGGENWAGYFTKRHPPSRHAKARPIYLKEKSSPGGLQGCAGLVKGHQPDGKKIGAQGQAQGLSLEAKDALRRALGIPAAPQA